jgi:hypothetical protein
MPRQHRVQRIAKGAHVACAPFAARMRRHPCDVRRRTGRPPWTGHRLVLDPSFCGIGVPSSGGTTSLISRRRVPRWAGVAPFLTSVARRRPGWPGDRTRGARHRARGGALPDSVLAALAGSGRGDDGSPGRRLCSSGATLAGLPVDDRSHLEWVKGGWWRPGRPRSQDPCPGGMGRSPSRGDILGR